MKTKRLTRGQTIKNYCKESCCAGSVVDWKECPSTQCPLWNFRLGKEIYAKTKTRRKIGGMLSVSHKKQASVSRGVKDSQETKGGREDE